MIIHSGLTRMFGMSSTLPRNTKYPVSSSKIEEISRKSTKSLNFYPAESYTKSIHGFELKRIQRKPKILSSQTNTSWGLTERKSKLLFDTM